MCICTPVQIYIDFIMKHATERLLLQCAVVFLIMLCLYFCINLDFINILQLSQITAGLQDKSDLQRPVGDEGDS